MKRTISQAGRYSVTKSKALERRVAKQLSIWTGVGGFRRTPGSGGFNKSYKTKVGEREFSSDIMCENELAFTIEVKSGKGFSIDAMISGDTHHTTKFTKWWYQTIADAMAVDKLPFLWFKPSSPYDWIALSDNGVSSLGASNIRYVYVNMYYDPVFGDIHVGGKRICGELELPNPYIFKWKEFVSLADPKGFFLKG